jgi:cytochrome c peroxidase
VELGHLLFFDKELSGNRNIACSTCHNPVYHTTDQLELSIGTGGTHPGPSRQLGPGAHFIARNSPDLFNRGLPQFTELFWDGRVEVTDQGLHTPAGASLPPGVSGVLAAQAMFPVTDRAEMRGQPGDTSFDGRHNELADIADGDLPAIWVAITARLLAIPEYQQRFQAAYPQVPLNQIGFEHAANAIAAFIATRWNFPNAPLDRYLRGDHSALSDSAKRGALVFFGKARCGRCHNGTLLSDMKFHDIAVPVFGPGFSGANDEGRVRVTNYVGDRFMFRTAPLRNVALTPPYMHNGAFQTLDRVVRHYIDPRASLRAYVAGNLDPRLQSTYQADPGVVETNIFYLDTTLATPLAISGSEKEDILAFLDALTDPDALSRLSDIPPGVPSGIPVFDY